MILLIEDNASDIELTRRAIQRSRVTDDLIVVEDRREALEYFFGKDSNGGAGHNELPRLVLLDLKIPMVDGLQVLKELRSHERTKRLPVVVLTTSNEERDIAESYGLGANSYIRKPVDFTKFIEAVECLGFYWLEINQPPPKTR
jgi:CheY-like chemotaxis protein